MSKEYSSDLQKLFLEMMHQNPESYIRVQNIYNPENFDRSLREAARFIKDGQLPVTYNCVFTSFVDSSTNK